MSVKPGVIHEGVFHRRLNRFLGQAKIDGYLVDAFVPNPGRMYELMVPGKKVYLRANPGPHRKTDFDMIAVEHAGVTVSIDSNLPNRFMKLMLESRCLDFLPDYDTFKSEPTYSHGRFDFLLTSDSTRHFIEVKSCTLVEDGRAIFPDAPTKRGARHMNHLADLIETPDVTGATVAFVIQRPDASVFSPNDPTDPAFADSLRHAHTKGVNVVSIITRVVDFDLRLIRTIPIELDHFLE